MNFEFSTEQLHLKDEARRLFADLGSMASVRKVLEGGERYNRALWAKLGELGFLGAAIPEAYGGTGAGYLELCIVAEEAGRSLAPIPFSSSICLGAELILAAGTAAQKARYLPRLAAGTSVACVAMAESAGIVVPDAIKARVHAGALSGCKWPVQDGDIADIAIVAVHAGTAVALYIVDLGAAGVSRSPLESIDPTRGQARLDFNAAPAELLCNDAWPLLVAALDRAAVLAAFEQVGGAERALQMARDYALERHAFGRPIGSFQAIKHKLVDMYVATVLARSNAYYAAWALSHDAPELALAAATARVSATRAYQLCAKENIQVHGGMGFTWDYDCHLYYRRANLLAVCLGGLSQWQDRLIACMRARRDRTMEEDRGL
jgi:acyl-CoA dehydrogenase